MNGLRKNIDEIKKHIKKHRGLFITNRCVGKTTALLELLNEDDDAYLITFNQMQKKSLIRIYKNRYNDKKEKRIISNPKAHQVRKGYIDEYFWHDKLYKDFKGAVSTMSFPIAIKKFSSNIDEREIKLELSDEQYNTEIGLKFK